MLNTNTFGYDLYEVADMWYLHIKGGPVHAGNFYKVVKFAVANLGFEIGEIEAAVEEMINKGHNASHFGMYKGFIFTFQKEFKSDRKAS